MEGDTKKVYSRLVLALMKKFYQKDSKLPNIPLVRHLQGDEDLLFSFLNCVCHSLEDWGQIIFEPHKIFANPYPMDPACVLQPIGGALSSPFSIVNAILLWVS